MDEGTGVIWGEKPDGVPDGSCEMERKSLKGKEDGSAKLTMDVR